MFWDDPVIIDQSALLSLEGKLNGINTQGRPRRMCIDDIKD